jgi:hypothetical protein
MERRLLKFKMSKEGDLFIKYEQDGDNGVDVITLETPDLPSKELGDAFNKMVEHMLDIGELPGSWREFLTMRGITVTWTNGVQGLVLTALRTLSGSNSPMTINTPHFTREPYNEDDESDLGIFSFECGEDLDNLEAEVFRFVDGARAQQELNFEEEQPEEVVTLA